MTVGAISDLHQFLLRGRNTDGGWGYYPGKTTRLEPTCWALLALKDSLPIEDLRGVLRRWPVRDDLLEERNGGDPNHAFHALGLLALAALGIEHTATNAALVRGLQRVKGFRVDAPNTSNRQDNTLQGWSWIPGTFSWVEPTAWALLALKKFRPVPGAQVEPARIAEGETLLVDRSCVAGGWNYGNSNMFGNELHPYAPTTAMTLLALQDQPRSHSIGHALDFLSDQATWERSGYAMSLANIALGILGVDDGGTREGLTRQISTTCELGNQLGAAQALYALRKYDGHAAFRL
jgi:hypothetical protein